MSQVPSKSLVGLKKDRRAKKSSTASPSSPSTSRTTRQLNKMSIAGASMIRKLDERESKDEEERIEAPGNPLPVAWLSNIWKGTGKPHLTCESCLETFDKKLEFTSHLYDHRMDEQNKLERSCNDCFMTFHNIEALKDHMKRSGHGCGQMIGSSSEVIKNFQCTECGSSFREKSMFEIHLETHRKKMRECKVCKKKMQKVDLQYHVLVEHTNVENDPKVVLAYEQADGKKIKLFVP